MIYSIGYERLEPGALGALLKHFAAALWDVRGAPRSRNPAYGRAALERALGAAYAWQGDGLGNKGACRTTPAGLDRLATEASGTRNVMLMCLECAPADCHRHQLIARGLLARGVDVVHIYRRELVLASELERALSSGASEYDCETFTLPT